MFDFLLHQPIRSKIISLLIKNEALPFRALKEYLEVSDGNLLSHLKKLEEAHYIKIDKFFEGRRPKSVVKITAIGRGAFKTYIDTLKNFIVESSDEK